MHIDAKVKVLPQLQTKSSQLHILGERIDVRWGDYSLIETEILLFEYAYKKQESHPYLDMKKDFLGGFS